VRDESRRKGKAVIENGAVQKRKKKRLFEKVQIRKNGKENQESWDRDIYREKVLHLKNQL